MLALITAAGLVGGGAMAVQAARQGAIIEASLGDEAALAPRRVVIGIDISETALAHAPKNSQIKYICHSIGEKFPADLAADSFDGQATDIDSAGRLCVATADGVRQVSAGDVQHLRPVG